MPKKATINKDRIERTFLVILDQTIEMRTALEYACYRALRTNGRVALLYVIETPQFQTWGAIENLMKAEKRKKAEEFLEDLSNKIKKITKKSPLVYLKEGKNRQQALSELLKKESVISMLLLATSTNSKKKDPLITYVTKKILGQITIPVMIIPGQMPDTDIARYFEW